MDDIQIKQAFILKEAKNVFKKNISEDTMESLYMVDIIQRLGVEHHFEKEIEAALQKQHLIFSSHLSDFANDHKLYDTALAFRLLRQGGHYVHADVFDGLTKSNKRQFIEKYGEDVKGLIALYESTQLSIEGEDDLDDIGNLSCQLLHAWLSRHQDHREAIYVANTLEHPHHHGLSRFMDRSIFLSDLKAKNEWTCLEELAEINSCILGSMNQNEIIEVFKWWKELGMAKEVKFSRYQPLKWYTWSMACFSDPLFSYQRIELTKPIALVYIIDDIFDVYGSLDQLTLFTDAVNRWELAGTEQLSEIMKICLSALYDITNDFAKTVYKKNGLNPIDTLKKSWVRLFNAFLEEAHWLNFGHLPKAEEYLNNGIVSTGVHVVLVHAFFFFLDQDMTKKTVAIMDDDFPNIIYSVAKILRLCDDLEGAKSEDQNGLDGSYLDCYMSEHQVSAEDAQRHVAHLISMEWKRLNREIIMPNPFPSSFNNFCLNAARMVPIMYHYRSNPCLANLQQHVKPLLHVAAKHI